MTLSSIDDILYILEIKEARMFFRDNLDNEITAMAGYFPLSMQDAISIFEACEHSDQIRAVYLAQCERLVCAARSLFGVAKCFN